MKGFAKRLNLLLLSIAFCVCSYLGYSNYRSAFRDDMVASLELLESYHREAELRFPDAPAKQRSAAKYGEKPPFDPDQYLA